VPEVINALLANLVSNLRLQDALDVAIVAFFFYRMVLIIRNTRAIILLQGLLAIFLLNLASSMLQLRAINWLLSRFVTAGVVALAIIFQDELRRVLEEIGRGFNYTPGMVSRHDSTQQDETCQHIVSAVGTLAQSRTGALLVLERRTGLQEFMDTGILVQGIVTPYLLLNIFIPNTPLHDGAVIMRGNRIEAAACFLPLSTNPEIDPELGTRHRAAIGITERSDALVVVVSEENGTISLAMNGKLTRYLDTPMLATMLQNALDKPEPQRVWRRWLGKEDKAND